VKRGWRTNQRRCLASTAARTVPTPRIVEAVGRRFRLEPEQPVPAEADSEVLGTTPAAVDVVPGTVGLKV
jgi:hypothetical protein